MTAVSILLVVPSAKSRRLPGAPRWNIPDDGYVTPRLKENKRVEAIGFVAGQLPGHQDYED